MFFLSKGNSQYFTFNYFGKRYAHNQDEKDECNEDLNEDDEPNSNMDDPIYSWSFFKVFKLN